jgi:hypothetical protein
MFRNYSSQYSQYLVKCTSCGGSTSKAFARKNAGNCKACVTGVETTKRGPRCPDCDTGVLTAYQAQHHYHCDNCTREADPEGYRREVMGLNDSYGD